MRKKIYGWLPDLPDYRDLVYKIAAPSEELPVRIDLRQSCPTILNQLSLGSCTANAISSAIEFEQMKKKDIHGYFTPSRLFIYYNERVMENSVNEDSGAMIRDGIKSVNKIGACKETTWTYDIKKFKTKPSKECYDEALNYKSIEYSSLSQDETSVKTCLYNGDIFVFGFTVYSGFESEKTSKTGIMTMPGKLEKCLGGHAVCCVGYDSEKEQVICRNSWGEKWGDSGYFYIPYEFFFSKLTSDFWVIKDVMI